MAEISERLKDELEQPYPLSKDQIESFRFDGFICLPDVFSADLLGYFGTLISEIVVAEDPNVIPLEEREAYYRAFTQIQDLWERHDAVRSFCLNRRCARIANDLLGCDGVRMWHGA